LSLVVECEKDIAEISGLIRVDVLTRYLNPAEQAMAFIAAFGAVIVFSLIQLRKKAAVDEKMLTEVFAK
jgi:hypothetical protein